MLEDGYDIRTVRELLGHSDVSTTMVYNHVLNRGAKAFRSPFDQVLSDRLAGRLPERAPASSLRLSRYRPGPHSRVGVFVASHHGCESGYCREVFDYCKPRLVVMSAGPIQHDTQFMASTYTQHASGEMFNASSGQDFRKVVTTRKDGNIFWNV